MDDTPPRRTETSRWSLRLSLALSETPGLSTASVILAGRDVPVFPCVPGGKHPLTTHGFHDATTDLPTVRHWWRRWPEANIGMPTGAASGVDVVDVDVHRDGSGFAAFEQARMAGLVDGWAWLVRTPSGGLHAYFLRTTPGEQRSWQVPSRHIDFRGDGGYIVVPPSRVATGELVSRRYRTIAVAQHQPEDLDACGLRAFLDPPRPARSINGAAPLGTRPDRLMAWVASRPEGARNHGLFWAACRMVEDGHSFEVTASMLGEAARAAGLSDREVQTTIRSAYRNAIPCARAAATRPSAANEAVSL